VRVIVVNKFWYRRGGLERVAMDEAAWLADAGHKVAHFSTRHPDNEPSPWSAYFAPYIELGHPDALSTGKKAVAAARMFWNTAAAASFARLVAEFGPDVVHVHGIHRQLSPSILATARRAGVPVVQTVHDYNPVCPADLLRRSGREICEPRLCGRIDVMPCVTHRCLKNSGGASALAAAELVWRRWAVHYNRFVAAFLAPSAFLAARVVDGGLPPGRTTVLPNAIAGRSSGEAQGYILFAGSVAAHKGVDVAVRAAVEAGVRLVVAGAGPLLDELREGRPPGVEFLGHVEVDEVERLMSRAAAVVVPSVWYENASICVLEALAAARPVIASEIGGLPEMVADGVEGLLVPPGDVTALGRAIRRLLDDAELAVALGQAGRDKARSVYAPDAHVAALERTYAQVMPERPS
jgi:glycosyltransferase involved in cell wall biosynthesis